MRGAWICLNLQITFTPNGAHPIRQFRSRDRVFHAGSEVPRLREFVPVLIQLLSKQQVSAERLEHMLPGANGIRAANRNRLVGRNAANDVRDQAGRRTNRHRR